MAGSTSFNKLRIAYKFDLVTNPAGAGQVVSAGKGAGSTVEYGKQTVQEGMLETDKETILEITGIQIRGPYDPVTHERFPIEYIRPLVGKQTAEGIFLNEKMAPFVNGYSLNNTPFQVGMVNTIFCGAGVGQGILASGPNTGDGVSWQPSLKVGPNSSLDVEVKFPLESEGGEAVIDRNMEIIMFANEIRGEDLYHQLLAYYGHLAKDDKGAVKLDGSGYPLINQGFSIGEIERLDEVVTIPKEVSSKLTAFSELNGGIRAAPPYMTRYLTYGKNGQMTQLNNSYTMEYVNRNVLNPDMEMAWNFEDDEALTLTHMHVVPTESLKWIELYKSGAMSQDQYDISPERNPFQPPVGIKLNDPIMNGPMPLDRPYTIHNRKGAIRIYDNGQVAAPAWSALNTGFEVGIYGYRYYL